MKKLLLLVVISSFAIGMVGCKGGEDADTTADATTGATTGTDAGAVASNPNPAKTNAPQPGLAVPAPTGSSDDPRWKAGTMLKGGEGK